MQTDYFASTAVSSWTLLVLYRENYNSPCGQPATATGKCVATPWLQSNSMPIIGPLVLTAKKRPSPVLLLESCHSEATSLTSLWIALMSCSTYLQIRHGLAGSLICAPRKLWQNTVCTCIFCNLVFAKHFMICGAALLLFLKNAATNRKWHFSVSVTWEQDNSCKCVFVSAEHHATLPSEMLWVLIIISCCLKRALLSRFFSLASLTCLKMPLNCQSQTWLLTKSSFSKRI